MGFASDVARACSAVVDEIPVQAPWSFGPIPPGSISAPSYKESVDIGVDWAVDWILAHPTRRFLLGGYSQGAECASRIYQETLPGGRLESVVHNFVAGYTFGNPSRQAGHTFYQGPDRPWRGIAAFNLANMDHNWADECDPDDMYASVPLDLRGDIMTDMYTLCTELQLHDFEQFCADLAANCLKVLQDLDGDAYDDLARRYSEVETIMADGQILPDQSLQATEDRLITAKGITAAIGAAIIGIKFIATSPPTAPHIQYDTRQVFPGQTYLQHAIQHVNHWATQ